MKMRVVFFCLFFGGLAAGWSACNGGESRDAILADIRALETKLATQPGDMNKEQALELIALQEKFASTFPKDTAANLMFFQASGVAHGIRDYAKSVALLDRFVKENPKHERVPLAVLTQGLILEQDLHKNDQAKEKYEAVVRQYPNSVAAQEAQQLLLILGKDPNELVKQFEAARNGTSEGK